ncbi:hypothetical protein N7447_006747 [Penicillium robsamsonii]|uniref:uncharacterized protein n=1 Tax=Penicillium robsamsonii TaxID=1792511 RepID=UPI0025468624|nr:uncharacterized protein N7447_006747 [Penicillium robsamsonii]KAJ5824407.1 hypothetical protein N7447_006747 [Penicillium robsamsonii]
MAPIPLLNRLKAIPLNENAEIKWTNQKSSVVKSVTLGLSLTLRKGIPAYSNLGQLSKIKEVITHLIFKIYNALFNHFLKAEALLKRKRVLWKSDMLKALIASRLKLNEYYS